MGAIVVTGAAGFVGRRLVELLELRGERVVAIGRNPPPQEWTAKAQWIVSNLLQPDAYLLALEGADCVIHLAAVTGKARPEEYARSNVEATKALLEACDKAGVKRFVLASSIAVTFRDRRHYKYAESKIAAEELTRNASIPTTIVRPTMILGAGSPIQASLEKLAKAPFIPVFGDGKVRVQPVDVEDVAEALANLAREPDAAGAVIEIGGPKVMTMNDLLAKLRTNQGLDGALRFAHIPLGPTRSILAALEGPLFAVLPLTAGQLASFANDGVAAPHPIMDRILPRRRETPSPLPKSPEGSSGSGGAPDTAITVREAADLPEEFSRHARYLTGNAGTPYQAQKYVAGHEQCHLSPQNRFDAFLLRFSRSGRIGLGLADSYSGLFYRTSLLRKKLVLALAILECSPPSFAALDAPDRGGRSVMVGMFFRLVAAAITLAAAVLVLLPAQIAYATMPKAKA